MTDAEAIGVLSQPDMVTRYIEAMAKSDGLPTQGTFTDLDYREHAEAVHEVVLDIIRGGPALCGYTWEDQCGPCMLPYKHEPPHVCGCEELPAARCSASVSPGQGQTMRCFFDVGHEGRHRAYDLSWLEGDADMRVEASCPVRIERTA